MTSEIRILLVEDNPGDARLVREAFAEWKLADSLLHVSDGVEAMAYLTHQGQYAQSSPPHLVLLDLNLPRKDGRQVLIEMKSNPALRSIPVVALTTSSARSDIDACYQAGANAYVTKPLDFSDFLDALLALKTFWFQVVSLPDHTPAH